MALHLGMTTCTRPQPYIQRSLESLGTAGFLTAAGAPLTVFAEPTHDLETTPPRVQLVVHPQQLGCFGNWKAGLTQLVAQAEPGDWLLMVQDDVIYRHDALTHLLDLMAGSAAESIGFASLYTSPAMAMRESKPQHRGWLEPTFYNNAFWGALTLAFPYASAQALLANERFQAHTHHRKVDVVVGNCMRDMNRTMLVHVPSLADHIGAYSTLGRHLYPGIQWGRRGLHFRDQP